MAVFEEMGIDDVLAAAVEAGFRGKIGVVFLDGNIKGCVDGRRLRSGRKRK